MQLRVIVAAVTGLALASIASAQDPFFSVQISRHGENSILVKVFNPQNVHIAVQTTTNLLQWENAYLGSTTNSTASFIHCNALKYDEQHFYRARTWNGPKIPPLPVCENP